MNNISNTVDHRGGSRVRLLVPVSDSLVNFGTFNFSDDMSLIFKFPFFKNIVRWPYIDIGLSSDDSPSRVNIQKRINNIPDGVHVSLHPKGQLLHIRENGSGAILAERLWKWFPVAHPFTFLKIVSPPIDECESTQKKSGFKLTIPSCYKDSLELKVNIFPRTSEPPFFAAENSIWRVLGHCRDYWVVCDVYATGKRSAPGMGFPIFKEAPYVWK